MRVDPRRTHSSWAATAAARAGSALHSGGGGGDWGGRGERKGEGRGGEGGKKREEGGRGGRGGEEGGGGEGLIRPEHQGCGRSRRPRVPGMAATTLASTRAPTRRGSPTPRGGRLGNRIDLSGEQDPQPSPYDDANGTPMTIPIRASTEACHATAVPSCRPLGETRGLQGARSSPSAYRRHQCQGER